MISSILKDLQQRFGSIIAQVIIALVIGILLVSLGKMAWNKVWGDDTDALKDRIQNQTEVIETITDINQENAQKNAKDRAAQEQAKNDLVEHIKNQAALDKKFEEIEKELQREQEKAAATKSIVIVKATIPFIKAAIKDKKNKDAKKQAEQNAMAKPVAVALPASPSTPEPEITEAEVQQEIAKAQQRARLVQDAVWKAYELANSVPQT